MPVTFSEFENTSLSSWKNKANDDLKGKKSVDDILYHVEPGLSIPAFVNHESILPVYPLNLPKTRAGVLIEELSNDIALSTLEHGAQALLIRWKDDTPIAPFFDNIILDIVFIAIDERQCNEVTKNALRHFMKSKECDKVVFLSDGVNDVKSNYTFQQRLQSCKDSHYSTILLELKPDFLAQIAELRALRIIAQNMPVKILAFLDPDMSVSTDRQALIAVNYALMSAYLGGADAVFGTIYSNEDQMGRLSLNIQHILQLESGITDVSDPMAGSYIVEMLTKVMANH